MGYTTDFYGKFKLNKKLDEETHLFLKQFNETRRMKFNIDSKYGVDGEFFVGHHEDYEGGAQFGQVEREFPGLVEYNSPPSTQPSLWCQWCPSEDGMYIEWDGGEKFYGYTEWLQYIIKNFLQPKGYILNGDVQYQGEDHSDSGTIYVHNNAVKIVNSQDELEMLRQENAKLKEQLAEKIILGE